MSTSSLLQFDWIRVQRQPMVDKRIAPAEDPVSYSSFTDWLKDATRRRSMKAELGRYCGFEGNQNVNKWLQGSVPRDPIAWKKIAEWAQVDYGALRDLIDKTALNRSSPKMQRAKGIAQKNRLRARI